MRDETIEDCDCEGTLFKEKCSKAQIENNFKSVCSNDPINYTLFNSNKILVKKSHLNYRQLLKINQMTKNDMIALWVIHLVVFWILYEDN